MNVTKRIFWLVVLAVVLTGALVFARPIEPGEMPTELPKAIGILVSLLAPLIYQLIIKRLKGETLRMIACIFLSALTGIAATIVWQKELIFALETFNLVFTFSTIAYLGFWKKYVFEKVGILRSATQKERLG